MEINNLNLLDIAADISTAKNKKNYEAAMKKAQLQSLAFQLIFQNSTQMLPRVEHPLHKIRLAQYIKDVDKLKAGDIAINFGDSLTDLARKPLSDAIDGIFSISGSWANHMSQMACELKPYLMPRINDIKYICVGTLGGNPLLVYQNYNDVVNEMNLALSTIRNAYPNAKIIIYSIPPTFNVYANTHAYQFAADILKWVNANPNSCLIDLHSQLGDGLFNLFPQSEWSADGVHLSPRGARKLASLINIAKKTNLPLVV